MTSKTASSLLLLLLLLVSIIQGLRDVQVLYDKTKEAFVGQNISLPCIVKEVGKFTIVSIEWSKKDIEPSKLALYTPPHGQNLFSSNVTLKIINDNAGKLMGTNLELFNIDKGHAGTYVCHYNIFPTGSRKFKTVLRIKDKIECDMNSTIEVNPGDNVTIHCSQFTDFNYTWTKDKTVVSDSSTLQLMSVSDTSAGLYTLTVNTGSSRLQVAFTISMQTQTTNLSTDMTTLSSYNSSSGVPESRSHAMVTTNSATDYTQSAVTSTPTTYSQPDHTQNTSTDNTYTTYNHSESFNTSQSFNQLERTTLNYNNKSENTSLAYNQTIETTTSIMYNTNTEYTSVIIETDSTIDETKLPNDSFSKSFTTLAPTISLGTTTLNPDATQTTRPGNSTDVTLQNGDVDGQSHSVILTLIIAGGVLLIIVAIVLYRRRMIKKRMDIPPPFKPPPPPVKYTAARSPLQHFPTDRCNSIPPETVQIRHTFV